MNNWYLLPFLIKSSEVLHRGFHTTRDFDVCMYVCVCVCCLFSRSAVPKYRRYPHIVTLRIFQDPHSSVQLAQVSPLNSECLRVH